MYGKSKKKKINCLVKKIPFVTALKGLNHGPVPQSIVEKGKLPNNK